MIESEEIWRPFPIRPWNEQFEVSNYGNIRTIRRPVSVGKDTKGYPQINISWRGLRRCFKVHRVVALAFLEKPSDLANTVNHKDFVVTNNAVNNLEWVTPKENSQHSQSAGRLRAGNKKIIGHEVVEKRAAGHTLLEIANEYNVSIQAISQYLKKQRMKSINT